jgi:hypothetical protein
MGRTIHLKPGERLRVVTPGGAVDIEDLPSVHESGQDIVRVDVITDRNPVTPMNRGKSWELIEDDPTGVVRILSKPTD